jgi:hypothetical protein
MQMQRKSEGALELSLEQNTSNMGRQDAVAKLAFVDAAEDNRSSRKISAPNASRKFSDGDMTPTATSIFLFSYFLLRTSRRKGVYEAEPNRDRSIASR